MNTHIPLTEFAPAERAPIEVVLEQNRAIKDTPLTTELLNSVLNCVFILNQQRQIIFASKNCAAIFPDKGLDDILGMRPGEALKCAHAGEMDGGCGTTQFCRECGAVKAIMASLAGQRDIQECRVTRLINLAPESMDLLVHAVPFTHKGQPFSIFSVADISHEKRRSALERIFFHDVINVAGGLTGLADMLHESAPDCMQKDMELLHDGLRDLLEEILSQRDLAAAERDELSVNLAPVHSVEIISQIRKLYQSHEVARQREIMISPNTASVTFNSDPILLKRVLGNLVKNALEASPSGQKVTLGCEELNGQVRFWVRNSVVMPPEVQLQVFNRSFTTKGKGRGLGTYSVKLICEKCLQGKADFTSTPQQGTTFFVTLPLIADIQAWHSS